MEKKDIESLVSALVPAVTEGVVTALRSMGVISPTTKDSDPPKQTSDSSTQVPPKDNSVLTIELPKQWSLMKESDHLFVVQLKSSDFEYSSVIDRFESEVGKRVIVKLERIQNKMLYQQYVTKKKFLESQNPKGTQNERELWHGTACYAVNSINYGGFNRSYCGKNATPYGEGVYFAVNANYAAKDTYSRPDSQGHKSMYLCKVLTGEYTMGAKGMRAPPQKPGQQSHILYDSLINHNQYIPGLVMFIIFNDTQAYPAYLITFK